MANFVKHTSCDSCGSSDGKAIYDDDSWHCWVCAKTKPSKEYIEQQQGKKHSKVRTTKKQEVKEKSKERDLSKEMITPEEAQEVKDATEVFAGEYRAISDEVVKFYGCRTEFDEDDNVKTRYYPCTIDGKLSGYKVRSHPKTFGGSIGITGKDCDLYGSFRFQTGGKYVLVVGGEEDAMAAFQMLKEYADSKNSDFVTAVVSATIGESGSVKQIAHNYEFLNSFDNVIIGYDADEAGEKAVEKLITVLPKGKVKIAKWDKKYKDPNKYLQEGKQRQFISDFYKAEKYIPSGVIGSNKISSAMREEFNIPKIPLPPFMHRLQKMMAGGIPLKRIVNLGSASGTGKSTIIDEIIYDMIFNSPHLVGIVTLEATKGQYGNKLLSRHIGQKIELLSNDDALLLLETELVKQKEYELFNNPDGTPRFLLVDDRDGEVDDLQDAIENMIISCGCKVVVLDPLSDIIASLGNDEQENFMSWQKGMVKSHEVTFLNVCHTRKAHGGSKAGSVGANLHEEDIIGSSSVYKSAACNLMFMRNKEAEDEMERNTTIMKATKIRWTGKTGLAGQYYYDLNRHTLYDLEDYLNGIVG